MANLACQALHGTEKACVDASISMSCTAPVNYPVAPSGLHGWCFNASDELTPADALYHECYAPKNAGGSCVRTNRVRVQRERNRR